jgi:hypothetical protein
VHRRGTAACRDGDVIVFDGEILHRQGGTMKRGFACGLGWCFALMAVQGVIDPANRYHLIHLDETALALEVGLVLATFAAFYTTVFMQPGRSWGRALLGGTFGFFAPIAVVLLLVVGSTAWNALFPGPSIKAPAAAPCLSGGIDCR